MVFVLTLASAATWLGFRPGGASYDEVLVISTLAGEEVQGPTLPSSTTTAAEYIMSTARSTSSSVVEVVPVVPQTQPERGVAAPPTTRVPAAQAPTTQAPTTLAPTTQAPVTQAPTPQTPTTQTPTTRASTNL